MGVRDQLFRARRKSVTPISAVTQQNPSAASTLVFSTTGLTIQAGDLLVAFFGTNQVNNATWNAFPSGFAKVIDDGSNKGPTTLAIKYADGTEGASITFTASVATNILGGSLLVYRNSIFGWTDFSITGGSGTGARVTAGLRVPWVGAYVGICSFSAAANLSWTPSGSWNARASSSDAVAPSWAISDQRQAVQANSFTASITPSATATDSHICFVLLPAVIDLPTKMPKVVATALTANGANSAALTINRPTGTKSLHTMCVVMAANGGTGTWTMPAGWTKLLDQGAASNSTCTCIAVRTVSANEPASYTFTHSVGTQILSGIILTYQDASYNAISVAVANTAGGQVAPTITPGSDMTQALAIGVVRAANATFTGAGATGQQRAAENDSGSPSITVFDLPLGKGMVYNPSLNPNSAGAGLVCGVILLLKGANVGVPNVPMASLATFVQDYELGALWERNAVTDAWSLKSLEDYSFSRASTATFLDSAGVLQTAPSGILRRTYDPATLLPRGYMSEEQRTNLLLWSEDLTNAAWTKTDSTITADAAVAPDGTTTMDLVTEGSAGTAIVSQNVTITANNLCPFSVFLKRANHDWVRVQADSDANANGFRAWVNLNTGVIGTTGAIGTGTFTGAAIENCGNGVYRVQIAGKVSAAATSVRMMVSSAAGDNNGARVSGGTRYQWAHQGEQDANGLVYATSYIKTTTAQVTRSADVLDVGPALGSWFNASEGTMFVEAIEPSSSNPSGGPTYAAFHDGTANNRLTLQRMNASTGVVAQIDVGGVTQMQQIVNGVSTALQTTKLALAYKLNNSYGTANGNAHADDAACTVPTVDRLHIGRGEGGGNHGGFIKRFAYYPTRLPSALINGITT